MGEEPLISIDFCIENDQWNEISNIEKMAQSAISSAMQQAQQHQEAVSLTLVFADNTRVETLNRDWRGKHKPTNILSFPAPALSRGEDGQAYLGDLIIAFEVVSEEAATHGKPLATHLCHLIIHGVLHLLGYDHQNDVEANTMEQLEVNAMASLGLPDPYQTNQI